MIFLNSVISVPDFGQIFLGNALAGVPDRKLNAFAVKPRFQTDIDTVVKFLLTFDIFVAIIDS